MINNLRNKGVYRWQILLCLFFPFFTTAQSSLDKVKKHIDSLDYNRNVAKVSLRYDPGQTLPNYYRAAYLYIHDELQEQLDTMFHLGIYLHASKAHDEQLQQLLENQLISRAIQQAKLAEINQIGKLTDTPGSDFTSPYELMSDWQLRSYHYTFQYVFALNEGFKDPSQAGFRNMFQQFLSELEQQLEIRELYQLGRQTSTELLRQRFELIHEINRLAVEEAIHFGDQSPNFEQDRFQLAAKTQFLLDIEYTLGITTPEQREADNFLPLTRHYLSESTINTRIAILEDGLRQLKKNNTLIFGYAEGLSLQVEQVAAQLAQERQWLYRQKQHEVVLRGLRKRGPPGDEGPPNFFAEVYPKEGLAERPFDDATLDAYLSDVAIRSIDEEQQKAFDRALSRDIAKNKVFNFSKPEWQHLDKNRLKEAHQRSFQDPFTFLKYHAVRYYENLAHDPADAALHKGTLEATFRFLSNNEDVPLRPLDLLSNDIVLLTELETVLERGIQGKELTKIQQQEHAEPWLDIEIENLKRHQQDLRTAKSRINISQGIGQIDIRPPPTVARWPSNNQVPGHLDLDYQSFHLMELEIQISSLKEYNEDAKRIAAAVMDAQKTELEKVRATYDLHAPPSVDLHINQIELRLATNEVCRSIKLFQKYQQDAALTNFLKNAVEKARAGELDEASTRFLLEEIEQSVWQEIENRERAAKTGLDRGDTFLQAAGEKSLLPSEITDQVHRARRTIGSNVKTVDVVEHQRYRELQPVEKVKDMTRMKEPGGVWLSPAGIEITPLHFTDDKQWLYQKRYEGCPTDYTKQSISPEAEDIICIRKVKQTANPKYPTRKIKPW